MFVLIIIEISFFASRPPAAAEIDPATGVFVSTCLCSEIYHMFGYSDCNL